MKSSLIGANDLPILHYQYHECWWPGDARSPIISSYDNDQVFLDQFMPFVLGLIHNHLEADSEHISST